MNEFISSEDISVKESFSNKTKKQTEKSPEQLSEENVNRIVNSVWTLENRKKVLENLFDEEKETIAKFEKSGIHDIFIKLRDSGEVKWSEEPAYSYEKVKLSLLDKVKGKSDEIKTEILDFQPAKITYGYYTGLTLLFDKGWYWLNGHDTCRIIEAKMDGDTLLINGKPVKENLLENVRNEIKETNFDIIPSGSLFPDPIKE